MHCTNIVRLILETDGYDLIVYIDHEGDVVCRALTEIGRDFMRMLFPGIDGTEIVELYMGPDEFIARVGNTLSVGYRGQTGTRFQPMKAKVLH